MTQYYTGLKLYGVAREKARNMGLFVGSMNMEKIIHAIQQHEGHTACFRRQHSCREHSCLWQAGCRADMS